jgi:hypothetical protein
VLLEEARDGMSVHTEQGSEARGSQRMGQHELRGLGESVRLFARGVSTGIDLVHIRILNSAKMR